MSLHGKHALITGASRGIGRGIALKLAQGGVKVAIHYYQNEDAAKQTLAEIRKRGSDGVLVQADVTRPEEITRMLGKVKADFGKLDIFVSNARPEAAAFFYPPMDITLEQWDAAFDSQAKAFLVGVREAVSLMGRGGRILAVMYAEGSLYRWAATLGRHGFSQGGTGVSRSLLRGGTRQTRHHGQCDQPWMDRRQRTELAAAAGARPHQELARARVDSNGTPGNARRYRQRCSAVLFRASWLDYGTGALRRRRRLIDESRSPAGNTARVAAPEERPSVRICAVNTRCLHPTAD